MNNAFEDVYNNYFKTVSSDNNKVDKNTKLGVDDKIINNAVYSDTQSKRLHVNEITRGVEYDIKAIRLMADDNIDEIEQLANILKKLCNAAWGENWGEFSPDLKKGEDSSKIILPQITIETNTREIDEALNSPKPKLTDIIKEIDDNGNETGDSFLIYRQWFAYNVEFNIYGRTSKEARDLRKRFENLITVYTGYLKRHGISEIWFETETSPKCSLNYDESAFMRCIYYYIRFETITPVRQSTINRINTEIGVGEINTHKVKTLIESNTKDIIDIDFFDGDNEITFNTEN